MNIRLIKTLAVIGTGLTVIIAGEIIFAKHSKLKLKEELTENTVKHIEREILPTINLKKTRAESYIDFVERPLFNHDRKPIQIEVVEEVAKKKVEVKKKVVVKIKPFKHELIGVYGTTENRTALFRRKTPKTLFSLKKKKALKAAALMNEDASPVKNPVKKPVKEEKYEKFIKLKIGMIHDGWKIIKIKSNAVVIENQGKIETVGWSKFRPKPAKVFKRIKARKPSFKKRKSLSKNIKNPFLQAQKKNKKRKKNRLIPPPPVTVP